MTLKVSVVVPVFNPGRYFDRCVDSVLAQSLPADEFEAIFVDDGSTDATPARLDALAARHPNLRVIHQPNSGWPGKPRNVGLDAAGGEYVFFADDDDALGPEALERMYAMAVRNGADIVIGKMVGHGRGVPRILFRRQRDRATLADAPLIDSLTPHKLFRRRFLNDHGLRFPEGRRRLEDHVFVVRSFFAAEVISVLADYDCYHHYARPDRMNAASQRLDPTGYFGNLREVLEIIEANSEPGAFRDGLLQRFARVELLNKLQGPRFLTAPERYRAALFAEIGAIIRDHIPTTVDTRLSSQYWARMALARANRLDLIEAFAEAEARVAGRGRLLDLEWAEQGRLHLAVEAGLDFERSTLRLEGDANGLSLRLPAPMADVVPEAARSVGTAMASPPVLVLRRRDDSAEIVVPSTVEPRADAGTDGTVEVIYSLRADLDPSVLATTPPRAATWDVIAMVWFLGVRLEAPVRLDRGRELLARERPGEGRATSARPRPAVTPIRTPRGYLALSIGRRSWRLRVAEARGLARRLRWAWAVQALTRWRRR